MKLMRDRTKEEIRSQIQGHSLLQNEFKKSTGDLVSKHKIVWKRGWKECDSQKMRRSGEKCCLLDMDSQTLQLWLLHKIKPTRSVTIVEGLTNGTQWVTKKTGRWKGDMLGAMQSEWDGGAGVTDDQDTSYTCMKCQRINIVNKTIKTCDDEMK